MRAILLLSLIILSSCDTGKESSDNNTLIAGKLFDAFNSHDWKTMASLYSDSARFLDPSFGKAYVNQSGEQIIAKYGELQKMFPDIADRVIGMYSAGDKVTVEFISSGTTKDGFKLNLPIVSIFTIADGRIVSDATYYDVENP